MRSLRAVTERLQRESYDPSAILDIGARYGLSAVGDVPSSDRQFSSLTLVGAGLDVLRHDGPPFVEFGNNGARFLLGRDHKASRRGYVAIKHRLPLPDIYVEANNTGPVTLISVAQGLLDVTPNDAGLAPDAGTSSLSAFKRGAVKFDHTSGVADGFCLWAREADDALARSMLSPRALDALTEIASSFDVELAGGWLIAYSAYGDVVTRDDEIWRWVFATTSRLLDLLADWADLVTPDAAWEADRRSLQFYTEEHVARPRKLNRRPAFLKE